MKTAISIPDPIFQAAEGLARRLGKSRSQLYTEAVSEYMKSHGNQSITEKLNEIYPTEDSSLDKKLDSMQMQSIPKEEW
jgi:metal-responsive CopG/Arc/MetJ family transcriptional regulator